MFFKYLLFRYNLFKYNQEYVLPYFKKMNIMEKKNFINQINMVPWKKCLKALEDKNVLKNPLPIEYEDINTFSIDWILVIMILSFLYILKELSYLRMSIMWLYLFIL